MERYLVGKYPFKVPYPDLFELCEDPYALVEECCNDNNWTLVFKKTLNQLEHDMLQLLYDQLQRIQLSEGEDKVLWALDKSRDFTTRSLYKFITFGGITSKGAGIIWGSKLPLKIKVFYGKQPTTNYILQLL